MPLRTPSFTFVAMLGMGECHVPPVAPVSESCCPGVYSLKVTLNQPGSSARERAASPTDTPRTARRIAPVALAFVFMSIIISQNTTTKTKIPQGRSEKWYNVSKEAKGKGRTKWK